MLTQSDGAALLNMSGVGLFERGRWRVRGVNLRVAPGEIVTLIGPNGSGKSTTAKLALGLLKPTEGRAEQRPNLRIGYVPQALSIDRAMPMTVERFMRLTNGLTAASLDAALDATGASALREKSVTALSGGEYQRVLIARAIAREPDLLVLDEPVQGVDLLGEAALYQLIADIRDSRGCGVLMISHDLHVVMAATDQVLCLNGHVCCHGAPQAVAKDPAYQALYGKLAPALAVYAHHHDHEHLPDGSVVAQPQPDAAREGGEGG